MFGQYHDLLSKNGGRERIWTWGIDLVHSKDEKMNFGNGPIPG